MIDRRTTILDAALDVISREGVEHLRMSDVGAGAGVSSALVHYYFATRAELIAQAFAYADKRADDAAAAEIAGLPTGRARIEGLLFVWTADDDIFRSDRAIWSEMWRYAAFNAEAKAIVEDSWGRWLDQIVELINEGLADGSIGAHVDPVPTAARLAAMLEGLGQQVIIGILSSAQMREIMSGALARELEGVTVEQRGGAR